MKTFRKSSFLRDQGDNFITWDFQHWTKQTLHLLLRVQGTVGNTQEGNHVGETVPSKHLWGAPAGENSHKGKNLQRLTFNSRILRLKAQRQRSPQWAAHVWGNLVEESQLKWPWDPGELMGSDGSRRTYTGRTRGWSRSSLSGGHSRDHASHLPWISSWHSISHKGELHHHWTHSCHLGNGPLEKPDKETASVTSSYDPSPSMTSDKIPSLPLEALKHFAPCLRHHVLLCIMGLQAHVQFFLLKSSEDWIYQTMKLGIVLV